MKQYTFKDGTKVIAGSIDEAKAKHRVVASLTKEDVENLKKIYEGIGGNKLWSTNLIGKGDLLFVARKGSELRINRYETYMISLYGSVTVSNGRFMCKSELTYLIDGIKQSDAKKCIKGSQCEDVNSAIRFFKKQLDRFQNICDKADALLVATDNFLK